MCDEQSSFLQNNSGLVYSTCEWGRMITATFQNYTGLKNVTIHAIRSAFVMHAKEHTHNEEVLRSIATAMRHSPRTQATIYDKRTANQKARRGLQFAADTLASSLLEHEPPETASTPPPKRRHIDMLVVPNEIVAVVNKGLGKVEIARVVSVDDANETVLINHMTETTSGNYKMKLGSRAHAAIEDVVTGIDTSFDEQTKTYKLRTLIQDIIEAA